jgi:hypothetical protein
LRFFKKATSGILLNNMLVSVNQKLKNAEL